MQSVFTSALLMISMLVSSLAIAGDPPVVNLVENKGQWPDQVLYAADAEHSKVFLEKKGLTFHLFDLSSISSEHNGSAKHQIGDVRMKGHTYHVNFRHCNEQALHVSSEKRKEYYNYFLGNEHEHWAGACRAYGRIDYIDLYPKIDMAFYSKDGGMKYDFYLHKGSHVEDLQMEYQYADRITLKEGILRVITAVGEVWEEKPVAWQWIDGVKKEVPCEFVLTGSVVSFSFPKSFDKNFDLIIDPVLIFSTYSGSFSDNFGYTATYDSQGYLYSGSSAFGQGYPTTLGAYQTVWGGGDGSFGLPGTDIALSKYDVSGTFMVWSTFLGGMNDELPHSLICNELDELLVYGTTSSSNFPVTSGAYDNFFNGGTPFAPGGVGTDYVNGSDIIVARLNASATALINSTFVGGNSNDGVNTATGLKFNYADEFRGEIDIDSQGNVVVASSTFSPDFPILNAAQSTIGGAQDACLFKLSPDLSTLIWSTFIGGTNDDSGYSAAFDSQDNVYICGGTKSQNFPTTSGSFSELNNGGSADGWIAHIGVNGNTILHCTYFGSDQYDQLYFVETDDDDQVHVYGQTRALNSTFIVNAGWSQPNSGMVVTKLNPSLSTITWSTVFGTGSGKPNLSPAAFLVDICGKIYLSGWGGLVNTSSNSGTDSVTGMTTTSDAYQSTTTGSDFYLLVLEADASNLVYASYYGGASSAEHVDGGTSRFDRKGVIYQSVCAGCGNNDDFPIFPANAVSPTNNSNNCNNGVFKFDFELPLTVADFVLSPIGCINTPIQLISTSTFAQTYSWDFGDLSPGSAIPNPSHIYANTGTYDITLIVTHPGTCNGADTLVRTIVISEPTVSTLSDVFACTGEDALLGPSAFDPNYLYSWVPSMYLSDASDPNPTFIPGVDTDYVLTISHGGCVDTMYQSVDVSSVVLLPLNDTTLCDDLSFVLTAVPIPSDANITWSTDAGFVNVINNGPNDHAIDVEVTMPTTFYVMAEVNGCSVVDQVAVNLLSFQTEVEGDFIACVNDTVNLSVLDPNASFTYSWEPANLIISGQNTSSILAIVSEETTFYVDSHTPNDCTAVDSVTVTVSNLTQGSTNATANPEIVVQGQSSQLNALPSGYNYSWSPQGSLSNSFIQNPIATPQVTTIYTVTVQDGECVYSSNVKVTVVEFVCGSPSIYVPDAFTPNADNRNEKLYVRANNIDKLYFVIYDRWGEKVFETTSLSIGWDGTFKGRNADPAVYVYYLEATCSGGETYFDKGNITLIR